MARQPTWTREWSNPGPAVGVLTMPATIGELWMVGYLCLRGIRRR
jgi:hypothetical protein